MGLTEGIDLAGAIASLIVAVGTGTLAWATFRLAEFTKATVANAENAMKQADKHHQENLRPLCVIEFAHSETQRSPFGDSFAPRAPIPGAIPTRLARGKDYISISGRLANKGLGPAKEVVVYLNFGNSVHGGAYWLTHPVVVCGAIGAGEDIDIDVSISAQNVVTKVEGGQRVPTQILHWVAQDAYEVVLRYRDIFDSSFRTVHAKGFPQNLSAEVAVSGGNKVLEAQQSTRPNRPTPAFFEGEQPWLTLADMPQPPPGWLGSIDNDPDAAEL